jgi:toxoflavin synthase
MTSPHYNTIAKPYRKSREQDWCSIEKYTLFSHLPDLSNLKVLDIPCGEGVYARPLKLLGAATVIGIDLSPKMIELAQQDERVNPLDIQYRVANVTKLEYEKEFDLVVSAYLFNYAHTTEELTKYCNNIFKAIKPGGQLVGLNDNPYNKPYDYGLYEKYGLIKTCRLPRTTGTPITYTMVNNDGSSCSFDNYYHSPEGYQDAFKNAGFINFEWINLVLSKKHLAADNVSHWNCLIDKAPVIAFKAFRSN